LARSAADRGFGTSSDSEVLEQELEMHSTSGSFLADGAFHKNMRQLKLILNQFQCVSL